MIHTKKKRVLLYSMFKYRDLPSLVLIKAHLKKSTPHKITIRPFLRHRILFDLFRFRPHLVVLPRFRCSQDVELSHTLKNCGIKVVVASSEGYSLVDLVNKSIAGAFVDFSDVDLFFRWNKKIDQLTKHHAVVAPNKCIIAGIPRFDVYHPKFHDILMTKEEFCKKYKINPTAKIVTLATNFTFAKLQNKPESIKALTEFRKKEKWGGANRVEERIKNEIKSRELAINALFKLARELPNIYLVIKTHPDEPSDWYVNKVKSFKLSNVRIISNEYIFNVLNASDLQFHKSCTTAIEGWLLGKPTINLKLVSNDWYSTNKLLGGEEIAYSEKDIIKYAKNYIEHKNFKEKFSNIRKRIINEFCGVIDGTSSELHAQKINELLKRSSTEPELPELSLKDTYQYIKIELSGYLQSLKNFLKFNQYNKSNNKWYKEQHFFTSKELNEWNKKLENIMK